MNNFNFTIIEGNLTTETSRKDNVVTFIIGSKHERLVEGVPMSHETNFRVIVIDRLADVCEKYLKVGSKVLVSGKLFVDDAGYFLKGSEVNFLQNKG